MKRLFACVSLLSSLLFFSSSMATLTSTPICSVQSNNWNCHALFSSQTLAKPVINSDAELGLSVLPLTKQNQMSNQNFICQPNQPNCVLNTAPTPFPSGLIYNTPTNTFYQADTQIINTLPIPYLFTMADGYFYQLTHFPLGINEYTYIDDNYVHLDYGGFFTLFPYQLYGAINYQSTISASSITLLEGEKGTPYGNSTLFQEMHIKAMNPAVPQFNINLTASGLLLKNKLTSATDKNAYTIAQIQTQGFTSALFYWIEKPIQTQIKKITDSIYKISVASPVWGVGYQQQNQGVFSIQYAGNNFLSPSPTSNFSNYQFNVLTKITVYGIQADGSEDTLGYLAPGLGGSFDNNVSNIQNQPQDTNIQPLFRFALHAEQNVLNGENNKMDPSTSNPFDNQFYYDGTNNRYTKFRIEYCLVPSEDSVCSSVITDDLSVAIALPTNNSVPENLSFRYAELNTQAVDDSLPNQQKESPIFLAGLPGQPCVIQNGIGQSQLLISLQGGTAGDSFSKDDPQYGWLYDYVYFIDNNGKLITNLIPADNQTNQILVSEYKGPYLYSAQASSICPSTSDMPPFFSQFKPFYVSSLGSISGASAPITLYAVLNLKQNSNPVMPCPPGLECGQNTINITLLNWQQLNLGSMFQNNQTATSQILTDQNSTLMMQLPLFNPKTSSWTGISYMAGLGSGSLTNPHIGLINKYQFLFFATSPLFGQPVNSDDSNQYAQNFAIRALNYDVDETGMILTPEIIPIISDSPNYQSCFMTYGLLMDNLGNSILVNETDPTLNCFSKKIGD